MAKRNNTKTQDNAQVVAETEAPECTKAPVAILASGNGAPVVDGLADADANTKIALAAELAALQRAAKVKARGTKERDKRHAKLVAKVAINPQLLPDTLRPCEPGELKGIGWVVEIACETCGEHRTVHTQDAHQVRFCEAHKADARKAASKERRQAKAVEKIAKLDEAEIAAQIAALKAELGETVAA